MQPTIECNESCDIIITARIVLLQVLKLAKDSIPKHIKLKIFLCELVSKDGFIMDILLKDRFPLASDEIIILRLSMIFVKVVTTKKGNCCTHFNNQWQ